VTILEREFGQLVDRVVAQGGDRLTIEGIVRQPALTIIDAMAGEAGRLSAAITERLAERTK